MSSNTPPKDGFFVRYCDMWSDFADYFRRYGGIREVVRSPYVLISVLITAACWGSWRGSDWQEMPLAVLPALLGFTLAAYALLLAFGDERFRAFLASVATSDVDKNAADNNALLLISAVFVHFIVIQVAALLLAVVAHTHPLLAFGGISATQIPCLHALRNAYAFVGFVFFVLSIAMALVTGLNIYRATTWYVRFKEIEKVQEANKRHPPGGSG